jgi:microcystin-dependent protein
MCKIANVHSGGVVGDILHFSGASVPSYALLCDGSAVSRSVYAPLFAVVGTTFGIGDGSTTFNVPNSLGKFLRGAGTNGAYSATLGASQVDATKPNGLSNSTSSISGTSGGPSNVAHYHGVTYGAYTGSTNSYGQPGDNFVAGTQGWAAPQNSGGVADQGIGSHTHSISGTAAAPTLIGDAETRPANVAVQHCIVYK